MANITNGAPISANYVPKFASATSINNSAIYQNGSNIGIGTTTPAATLDVAGIIQITGFKLPVSPVAGYVLTSDASGVGTWKAPGIGGSGAANYLLKFTGANTAANSVVIETGGNIGIGTTTPGSKLDVNGTTRLGGTVANPGVHVDGTGNVGVGTAAPTQKLDVSGNINITGSMQALQSMLALSGLTGRSSSAATPAGVFDNTAGGKILSGQASGLEKFSVDAAGNLTAAGTAQVTGLKLSTGASNGYVLTSDPSGNAAWQPPTTGGPFIGGTGTPNAFPMFTAATMIGDSPVYECNNKIGIGIDLPQEELTLAQDSNLATEMQVPSNITYGFQTGGGLPADDYYFVLAASDGVGWTKGTAEILVTLGPTDHTISLQWSAVVGASNYRVYRALTPGGPYKYIETSATNFDYTNDGLFIATGTSPMVTTAYVNKLSSSGNSWFLGSNVGIGTTTPNAQLDVKGAISGFGIVPIGSIMAWHKSLTGTPALPDGWAECNGQKINDLNSPYNGQAIPALNAAGKFLRGSSTGASGAMEGSEFQNHAHVVNGQVSGSHPTDPAQVLDNQYNNYSSAGGFKAYTWGVGGGGHTHSFSTVSEANGGAETRPTNMSVIWIMRIK